MDTLLFARYRRAGGTTRFLDWEFSAGVTSWEEAPAPAHVGKRLVDGLFQVQLPPTRAAREQRDALGVAIGLYQQIWKYDAKTLSADVWERLHDDSSGPDRVVLTTTDSNAQKTSSTRRRLNKPVCRHS
jgi:hypothetical protein